MSRDLNDEKEPVTDVSGRRNTKVKGPEVKTKFRNRNKLRN